MTHNSSPTAPTPTEDRDVRRQRILDRLRADPALERMADELTDLPDDEVFGQIEYTLRDLGHELAANAHQAGLEASKKRGTSVRASSAPTAGATPAS
jgi:hypothetical protein